MAGFDLNAIGGSIMQWIVNPLLWGLIIVFVVAVIFLFLYIRKKRKLVYKVVEVVDLGEGKTCLNTDMKAGWYGKKKYLGGLWWGGEEVLQTNHGDTITYFSTEDFQEVDGSRGVVCYRDPVRQKILIPVSRLQVKNKELVAAIAPADFTEAAIDIVRDATLETSSWKDKLLQFGMWAIVVIVSLVAIIIIIQYVKTSQKDAADLLVMAGTKGAEACKNICKEVVNVAQQAAK